MAYHGKSLEALANWIQLYSTICILWKIRYDMLLLLLLLPPLLPLALLSLPLLPQLPLLLLPLLLFPLLLLPLLLAIFFGTRSPKHCAFDAGLAACMCNTKQQPHYTTLLYNTARVQLPLRTINVSALHNPFYSSPFHYIPWHWTALHYINCITYHCVTWQWFCITLHCVESHYIALHLYIHYIRYIAYVYICFDTGFFKKNSHPPTCCHITPDPPAPPWSMLLPNACRHPNRNGCFFLKAFRSKAM